MSTNFGKYLTSSIMRKYMMAVTGLLLCGFMITHLLGNLLVFVGPQAFNTYSHKLISNPAIYLAEIILLGIFLSHIILAISLTIENKKARPVPYYFKQKTGKGATFASSTMPYTGILILLFLVWHIVGIKYGVYFEVTYEGEKMRDLYKLIMEYFSHPKNVLGYLVGMTAFGIHASHGFWSAFQSLGFNHPKYNGIIRITGIVYAYAVAIGMSSIPIYCFLKGGH